MAVDGSKETGEVVRTQSHVSRSQVAAEAEAGEPAGAKEDGTAYILFEVDVGVDQWPALAPFRALEETVRETALERSSRSPDGSVR